MIAGTWAWIATSVPEFWLIWLGTLFWGALWNDLLVGGLRYIDKHHLLEAYSIQHVKGTSCYL